MLPENPSRTRQDASGFEMMDSSPKAVEAAVTLFRLAWRNPRDPRARREGPLGLSLPQILPTTLIRLPTFSTTRNAFLFAQVQCHHAEVRRRDLSNHHLMNLPMDSNSYSRREYT